MPEPPTSSVSGVTMTNGPKVDARDVPRACPPQERFCGEKLAICWEPRVSGATAAKIGDGENASGAGNQQERPEVRKCSSLPESSEAKRQPPRASEAKIWSEPHGDMWRTRAKFLVG